MRIRIVFATRRRSAVARVQAAAQINSGVITGIVTDPQKAVVPNAKVEVVEDDTKFSYSATTNGRRRIHGALPEGRRLYGDRHRRPDSRRFASPE